MTLGKKKETRNTPRKFKPKFIIPTEKGIKYIPTGEVWNYPIFVGDMIVHNISSEPLKVEFLHEGKNYVFVFYDQKLGMVAKARIARRHAYYIVQELISRKGDIPKGGFISEKKLNEILSTASVVKY